MTMQQTILMGILRGYKFDGDSYNGQQSQNHGQMCWVGQILGSVAQSLFDDKIWCSYYYGDLQPCCAKFLQNFFANMFAKAMTVLQLFLGQLGRLLSNVA